MVHDEWSLQRDRDSNPRPLGCESSPLPLDHGVLPALFTLYKEINIFSWIILCLFVGMDERKLANFAFCLFSSNKMMIYYNLPCFRHKEAREQTKKIKHKLESLNKTDQTKYDRTNMIKQIRLNKYDWTNKIEQIWSNKSNWTNQIEQIKLNK